MDIISDSFFDKFMEEVKSNYKYLLPFIREYQDYLKTYDAITNAESGVLELVEQMCQKYPQDSLFQFHVNRIRSGVISPLIVMEDK